MGTASPGVYTLSLRDTRRILGQTGVLSLLASSGEGTFAMAVSGRGRCTTDGCKDGHALGGYGVETAIMVRASLSGGLIFMVPECRTFCIFLGFLLFFRHDGCTCGLA